jgi:flagellar M-ring protein FliF
MAATLEATQAPNAFNLGDFIRQLFTHLGTILTLAAVLALGVGVSLWSIKPEYSPVYSNLSQADVAMVADVLRSSQIPFRMDSSSGMIMVANNKINEAKILLASEGLPQSNGTGYELLNNKPALGTSQFMETARYQHALETELSRTISGMRNIENSRVHIATPKQSVFVRNRGLTSASVMIKLMPGRVLESGQVSSITHLVASSVPYLNASNVTIVDQWGKLLSSTGDDDVVAQSNKQLAYKKSVEQTYASRIEALLSPIYGRNKIKAQVNAEVEFTKSESAEELYDPDSAQVRSEQISEQSNRGSSTAALGIPGALTNQPPAGGTLEEPEEGDENATQDTTPLSTSQNSTKNYELDKTMRYTQEAKSLVNRITVAIVVDDKDVVNEAGETVKTPLASEDFALIRGIVRDAIGFNEERGDSVTVYNSSFLPEEVLEEPEATPIWKQPWLLAIIKQVFAGISVLIILFMFVKPAIKSLSSKNNTSGAKSNNESGALLENSSGAGSTVSNSIGSYPNYVQQLAMAKELVSQDPKQVAKIVKNWVTPSGE